MGQALRRLGHRGMLWSLRLHWDYGCQRVCCVGLVGGAHACCQSGSSAEGCCERGLAVNIDVVVPCIVSIAKRGGPASILCLLALGGIQGSYF